MKAFSPISNFLIMKQTMIAKNSDKISKFSEYDHTHFLIAGSTQFSQKMLPGPNLGVVNSLSELNKCLKNGTIVAPLYIFYENHLDSFHGDHILILLTI